MHSDAARARLAQNFVVDGRVTVHHERDDRHTPYRHPHLQRYLPFSLASVQASPPWYRPKSTSSPSISCKAKCGRFSSAFT